MAAAAAVDRDPRRRRRRPFPGEVPYVSPDRDRTRYYADRFYLDAPTGLSEYERRDRRLNDGRGDRRRFEYCDACGERTMDDANAAAAPAAASDYYCYYYYDDDDDDGGNGRRGMGRGGGDGATIMFDRSEFVNSLDLAAVIIGTYAIGDADYLTSDFPSLFPPSTTAATTKTKTKTKTTTMTTTEARGMGQHVPTLVLHDRRTKFDLGRVFRDVRKRSSSSSSSVPEGCRKDIPDATGSGERRRTLGGGVALDDKRRHDVDDVDDERDHPPFVGDYAMSGAIASTPIAVAKTTTTTTTTMTTTTTASTTTTGDRDDVRCRREGGTIATTSTKIATNAITTTTAAAAIRTRRRPRLTFEGRPLKLPRTPKRYTRRGGGDGGVRHRRDFIDRLDTMTTTTTATKTTKTYDRGDDGTASIVIDTSKDDDDDDESRTRLGEGDGAATAAKMMSSPSIPPPPPPPPPMDQGWDGVCPVVSIDAQPHPSPSATTSSSSSSLLSPPPRPRSRLPERTDTAGEILSRVLGRPVNVGTTMRPIVYDEMDVDDDDTAGTTDTSRDVECVVDDRATGASSNLGAKADAGRHDDDGRTTTGRGKDARPTPFFGGEVFFTRVRPRRRSVPKSSAVGHGTRWAGPSASDAGRRCGPEDEKDGDHDHDDDDDVEEEEGQENSTMRGVHHPKFFMLFERSGSLVVIISTSNLTPQTAIEGSWVQRFESRETSPRPTYVDGVGRDGGSCRRWTDHGMPSDFGAVLTDFLEKQSEAAATGGGMLPDAFLRRYVPGLSSGGLASLADRYRFEDAQAHLVSTVPGEYVGVIPIAPGNNSTRRRDRVAYGSQRVAFVLSRILDHNHIRSAAVARAASTGRTVVSRMEADIPWFPPSLVRAKDRLVVQPTSLGGNWTSDDLGIIVRSYLQPYWELPKDGRGGGDDDNPLLLLDIVWPSMDYADTANSKALVISANGSIIIFKIVVDDTYIEMK
ncbi:hypothetical protein ACHAXA_001623 [Cyclostephanos tholiformis]|uniref:Uncharacterized protein n=1 Tax=Cyclostephanos tholiformis TaxID=382380 RepID=A0ABD3RA23_9STRA